LGLTVNISGSSEKGKVTVSYTAEDDLRSVAEKLGGEFA
jgi:ParB family chromosome partitioning protein